MSGSSVGGFRASAVSRQADAQLRRWRRVWKNRGSTAACRHHLLACRHLSFQPLQQPAIKSMSARDLYATLGVRPDANAEEIQAAYTRATQARQTALDDAFQVLSNPETRKAYDLGRSSSSPLAMIHNTEDVRVPSLLASPLQLLGSILDPMPARDRDPWAASSSPFGLFGRMLTPFADPTPVWSTLDPSLSQQLSDADKTQGQAERSPGLFERLFGTSGTGVDKTDSAVPGADAAPRFTSYSRSYTSSTEDGNTRVRAEQVGPDVRCIPLLSRSVAATESMHACTPAY